MSKRPTEDAEGSRKRRRTSPSRAFARLSIHEALHDAPEMTPNVGASEIAVSPSEGPSAAAEVADVAMRQADVEPSPLWNAPADDGAADEGGRGDPDPDGVHINPSAQSWIRSQMLESLPKRVSLRPPSPDRRDDRSLVLYSAFTPWTTPRTAQHEVEERANMWRSYLSERQAQEAAAEPRDEPAREADDDRMELG